MAQPLPGSVIHDEDRFTHTERIIDARGNPPRFVTAIGYLRSDGATLLQTCTVRDLTGPLTITWTTSLGAGVAAFARGHTVDVVYAAARTTVAPPVFGSGVTLTDCAPLADRSAKTLSLEHADALRIVVPTAWRAE